MRGFDWINTVLLDRLILQIFRQLESWESRDACSVVCKRWLSLEHLNRETIYISTSAYVKLLSRRFVSVEVTISGRAYHFNQFALSGESVSEENGMRKCCFPDSVLAAVRDGFTKLEILRLMWFPDAIHVGLISIAEKCKLLVSLQLEECHLDDEALAAIGKYCSRLEDINLRDCVGLTDAGLFQLAVGCGRTLKSLGVASCESLTDISLEAVGIHCPSLQSLSLVSSSIDNKGLLSVAVGCCLLKSLKVQFENMMGEALQAVGSFSLLLEFLSLCHCAKLTDRSLCAIGKGYKKLKKLSLEYCLLLHDMGLDSVARLRRALAP
ncbi:F-box/LRR-repeat protein 4-like [Olea europaea var. sylvestris]|uniref:F-box/LRR-repeat protein 4-like n=1 Tax=Olea europaea var. sylvestris TaxID=158386 RepID=UPI000C1D4568|nr:F-box/LRR-repeat protein 4-like [Olea europaea var. sylvestris]